MTAQAFGTWTDGTSDLMYRGAMPYLLEGLPCGQSVVDLGGGSGLSRVWWPRQPVDLTTVDSDPETHPDVLADVLTYAHPEPVETVLMRYLLHYLSDDDVVTLFAQVARWHFSNVIVVQFASDSPADKAANSGDTPDRYWRTPLDLGRVLTRGLPNWTQAGRVNSLDFTVRPEFYANRLGVPGKFPHRETLIGLNLERRVTPRALPDQQDVSLRRRPSPAQAPRWSQVPAEPRSQLRRDPRPGRRGARYVRHGEGLRGPVPGR